MSLSRVPIRIGLQLSVFALFFVGCTDDTGAPPTTTDLSIAADMTLPDGAVPSCDGGFTACGGGCVNLQSNARHCGACDHACLESETCQAGLCVVPCAQGTT